MSMTTITPLTVSAAERRTLEAIVRSGTIEARLSRRARAILLLAEGASVRATAKQVGLAPRMVQHWKHAFLAHRVAGLQDAPRAGRPKRIALTKEARILANTQKRPPAPLTHWSSRRMAQRHGVSQSFVTRLWRRHGLKPHRIAYYVASPDPAFEAKAAAILGLYLHPPAHAVVLCIDEKSTIQALDRSQPSLPLSPGRAERHSVEYVRRGTLSLYAALEVSSGHVQGHCAPRHTATEFVRFLEQATRSYRRKAVHLILDNFTAHKTAAVQGWVAKHPHVHLHYTPTYSSWLNQVELWFGKIERDCIERGIFTSTQDLKRKLLAYIDLHNKEARPFLWTYNNPKRRIRVTLQ
jgi:transposase